MSEVIRYLAVIVCLLGLLLYGITDGAKYPKVVRVGEIMFAAGLLVVLAASAMGR